MKSIFLTIALISGTYFSFYAQDMGKNMMNTISECNCNEITFISGAYEKRYSRDWIASAELKNGMIVLQKGNSQHQWNPEKLITVEKGADWIRFYFEQTR